jgi:DNA-binding GntR family transcriptional regulator
MLSRPLHRTKQEMAYDALRTSIMRCELKPGDRLIIDDISRQLGVSHIPVREALHQLQSDGLVVTVPHAGATVAPLSRDDITEVFSLMEGLELVALRVAAATITPPQVRDLRTLLTEMDEAVEGNDYERWSDLNSAFHREIARIADMQLLREFTDRTLDKWERVRRFFNVISDRFARAQEQHHAIMTALETGDIDRLEEVSRQHNREALDAYLAEDHSPATSRSS